MSFRPANSFSSIMLSVIEEKKENMTDEIYLSLCNILKEVYNEEQKNEGFYELEFLYTIPKITGSRTFDIDIVNSKKIVKLSLEECILICKDLEDNSFCRPNTIPSIESLIQENCVMYKDEAAEINDGDSEIFIFKSAVIIKIQKA